jgi:hypothetical protein
VGLAKITAFFGAILLITSRFTDALSPEVIGWWSHLTAGGAAAMVVGDHRRKRHWPSPIRIARSAARPRRVSVQEWEIAKILAIVLDEVEGIE